MCGQSTEKVEFCIKYNGKALSWQNDHDLLLANDSIQVTCMKFYISNLQCYNDDVLLYEEPARFHLLDVANAKSMSWNAENVNAMHCNKVKFWVGVDSLTHTLGAMDGDLDPIHGMYWTWQSGYVNFKIEGKYRSNTGTLKEFQYHIGGYNARFNTLQEILLPIKKNKLHIFFDLSKFLSLVDISGMPHIMSPCKDAVHIAQSLSKCFNTEGNE